MGGMRPPFPFSGVLGQQPYAHACIANDTHALLRITNDTHAATCIANGTHHSPPPSFQMPGTDPQRVQALMSM